MATALPQGVGRLRQPPGRGPPATGWSSRPPTRAAQIFSILDLNRDRRLGLREVRGTPGRVSSWDRDGDGRIAADEDPPPVTTSPSAGGSSRGIGNPGLVAVSAARTSRPPEPIAGPSWFRRMDRNRDGDVSAREFRGPRPQFDRLDRDQDGLIDPAEAAAAGATASAAPKPGVQVSPIPFKGDRTNPSPFAPGRTQDPPGPIKMGGLDRQPGLSV